jgi:predicted RNase H-like nuclease (RuvC/YqgF family)
MKTNLSYIALVIFGVSTMVGCDIPEQIVKKPKQAGEAVEGTPPAINQEQLAKQIGQAVREAIAHPMRDLETRQSNLEKEMEERSNHNAALLAQISEMRKQMETMTTTLQQENETTKKAVRTANKRIRELNQELVSLKKKQEELEKFKTEPAVAPSPSTSQVYTKRPGILARIFCK